MELTYRKATIGDLELLVRTRIKVLRCANQLPDTADLAVVEAQSRIYYINSLGPAHVAYLVFDGNVLAGCGGASFYQVMPTCMNPSGKKAYIMNMYTEPDYRRRGIAWKTLDLLVNEARSRGVVFITLEATNMGRPLYEKYGFIAMDDEMILPFDLPLY